MNSLNPDLLLNEVASYYSEKLLKHGTTPQGVDWNGEESQVVRFQQLCKIFEISKSPISINDLGCGYGSLLEYVDQRFSISKYLGIDISESMIRAAIDNIHRPYARFITASIPDEDSDFGIASGIFNVRLGRSDDEWLTYFQSTLDIMNETSKLGFAFNCLTSYSDQIKMKDYLFYADPCQIFDLCKKRYSRNVALLHDYDLYEFTIHVKKNQ